MKPIEQYKRYGLEKPITIRPGLRFHLLLWGGGSFLILGSIAGLASSDLQNKLIGAFGLIFFGLALSMMVLALVKSGSRGLMQISKEGIYMSHLGVLLPWKDIGPAWCSVTKHQGMKIKDVAFLLRNVSQHTARMEKLGKLSVGISKRMAHSKPGGLVEWGLKAFMFVADADDDIQDQLKDLLAKLRETVANESDSTVFNIPTALRFGIAAEDLLAIINHEVALYNGFLQGSPQAEVDTSIQAGIHAQAVSLG
jgi:hypothetical protein